MAVEIPVIVDIDKAFQDAAARVGAAIKPLQRQVDANTLKLDIVIGTDDEGNAITTKFSEIKKGAVKDMTAIRTAIEFVNQQLVETAQSGDKVKFTAFLEAKYYLEDMVNSSRIAKLEINGLASTMSGLSAKIQAARTKLETTRIGSPEWKEAAKELQNVSTEMQNVENRLVEMGMKTKSVDQLNYKLGELERKWNALGERSLFDSSGNLTKKAQKMVTDYKAITKELEKQDRSLRQIISDEARAEALRQKGIQTRRYENAILKSTATTMRVLEEKERILSERLSRTRIGSGKYQQLKRDLEGVRAELDKLNGRVKESTVPTLDKANSRIATLVKRSLQLFAIHSATRFVQNIREVTAEFELQRVALGSIIQDTEKANSLFKQIKAAAVESPFQIKELVTYTKQLSAYRIETEDLFKVTMKLADVSAGLGVDMGRLILAYGQVRAAAVLRGQELRQFTEAGIPLVEKLAEKFTKLRQETVSTADVFELISKRAVPFEMVAEIFDDMTERGGIFYKMQEKQAETLAGQWSNLKDSLSIMYDEMGNTSAVHGAMEALIRDAKTIFQNWHLIANAVKIAAIQFGALKFAGLWLPNLKRELALAKKAQDAFNRSLELSKYAQETGSAAATRAAARQRLYSVYMRKAAMETNFLTRATLQLKAVMAGASWVSVLITALTALGTVIASVVIESNRLSRELSKIGTEGNANIDRSVANFERLANQAVNAADGSREQAKAQAELERTYGDLIPTEQLQIEHLRELKGNYDSVTRAIREKINEQIREQKVSTITDTYSKKLSTKQQKAKKDLAYFYGLDKEQIGAILEEIQKEVEKGSLTIETTFSERRDIFEKIIEDLTGQSVRLVGTAETALNRVLDTYLKMDNEIKDVDNSMKESIGTYGKFGKIAEDMGKSLQDIFVDEKEFGAAGTFANNQEKIRQSIEVYWDYLQKAFNEVNATRKGQKIDITQALLGDGKIDFDVIEKAVKESMKGGLNTRLDTFVADIRKKYEALVPSDRIANAVREKVIEIANQYGVSMDVAQRYFKNAETSMEDYLKSLKDAVDVNDFLLKQMEFAGYDEKALAAQRSTNQFLEALYLFFGAMAKATGGGGGGGKSYTQDPFIAQMRERMKFMQDFKKGYEDLSKFMTEENALAKEGGFMEARGLALGISPAEQQKAAKELSSWYESARKEVFEQARKHGATGTIESFLRQEIKDTSNKGKALKEFQQLLQSLFDAQTDLDIDQAKKDFEDALAKLKDDIKRSEEVKNFYRDIFDLTGDEKIASNLSLSVYGDVGKDLGQRLKDSLQGTLEEYGYAEDSDIFKTLTESAKNLDFRDVMKNIDKVPEELRTAVKEAAAAAEKYNSDIAKSYAKLLLKFDEIEQQRVNITNQAAKDIETIEKGLDLELKGIRENAAIEDKEAAEKAARERAEAAKAGIISERDLGLKRLEREYRMFFNSVGVISNHAARKVARTQKEMITEQFNAGQKTLAQYKREIREIDEQLRKYENNRGILVTYLTGGTDAAIDKLSEFSDGLIAIADSAFNKKNGSWLIEEDEKEYIDKLGKIFGGKIFGVAGRKNILEQLIKMNEGDPKKIQEALEGAAEAIKEMGANMSQGIGWADFWVSLFGNAIKGLDELAEHSKNASGEVAEGWNDAANIFLKFGTFGLSKSSDAWDRLTALNEKAMSGFEKFKSGDFFGAIVDNIQGWMEVFGTSTKAIDRQIKEQSGVVDELKYQYDRLGVAIEEAFGSDYIYNFQKQQEILQAQAEAYRKQAELEREKGKKADEETAQGYENSAREIEDQIKDMQGQLAEFFTGTDLTSAARDFAQAWIEAYKEFGSTTEAMREKFHDMIENMVVNSLAAQLIQGILKPVFKAIDTASEDGALTAADIATISAMIPERLNMIDGSMNTLMNQLTAAGVNLRQQAGQFTGISRDIAGASEESILGLSAGVNTANFYMSHLPAIAENVAALRAYIVGDAAATVRTTASEGPTYEDQMLSYAANLPMMRDDMYAVRSLLEKVIKPVGTAYYVSVR